MTLVFACEVTLEKYIPTAPCVPRGRICHRSGTGLECNNSYKKSSLDGAGNPAAFERIEPQNGNEYST